MRTHARTSPRVRWPSLCWAVAVVTFAISSGVACAGHGSHGTGEAIAPAAAGLEQPVVLTVENRNWQDVVVYAVYDGTRNRLGMINTARTVSFRLASRLVGHGGSLYFIADPIGASKHFQSEMVVVQPGQVISWTLESGLERSSISISN